MSRCVIVVGQAKTRENISVDAMSFEDIATACIHSLWKNAPPDRLFVYWEGEKLEGRIRGLGPTTFAGVPDEVLHEGYDAYKILMLDRTDFQPDDEVILLDLDTLITGDIWDAFTWHFDVAIPSRLNWLCSYPVNIGLVAFRWTEMARQFVHDWAGNILTPDFKPYRVLRAQRDSERDFCRDEDYANAIVRGATMGRLALILLPPEFNWFPTEDTRDEIDRARRGYEHGLASGARMLHFKGENKVLIPEFTERIHVAV